MVHPYISFIKKQYRAAPDDYLDDHPVQKGHILTVTHVSAFQSTPTDDDEIDIGINAQGQRFKLWHTRLNADPTSAKVESHIYLPEGYRIYAYFGTAAAGDDNELTVCGILQTVEEFEREHGGKS